MFRVVAHSNFKLARRKRRNQQARLEYRRSTAYIVTLFVPRRHSSMRKEHNQVTYVALLCLKSDTGTCSTMPHRHSAEMKQTNLVESIHWLQSLSHMNWYRPLLSHPKTMRKAFGNFLRRPT